MVVQSSDSSHVVYCVLVGAHIGVCMLSLVCVLSRGCVLCDSGFNDVPINTLVLYPNSDVLFCSA